MKQFQILNRHKTQSDLNQNIGRDLSISDTEEGGAADKVVSSKKGQTNILDRGPASTGLYDHATEMIHILSSSNTLFARRLDYSERFLYKHCINQIIFHKLAAVIAPIPTILSTNNIPSQTDNPWEFVYDASSYNRYTAGKIYTLASSKELSQLHLAEFLIELHSNLKSNSVSRDPIVLLIDILSRPSNELISSINQLLFRKSVPSINIWMHCSLPFLDEGLIGQFVNVLSWLPSIQEAEILRTVLPMTFFSDEPFLEKLRGSFVAFGPCVSNDIDTPGKASTACKIFEL